MAEVQEASQILSCTISFYTKAKANVEPSLINCKIKAGHYKVLENTLEEVNRPQRGRVPSGVPHSLAIWPLRIPSPPS